MTLFTKDVQYVFSGKSALVLVLRYLRRAQVLVDKSEQVLVPEWLGTWVYMTMHNYCFPTTVMNTKVKAILAYHQWGFPQRMEKIVPFAQKHGQFLIEDCAHAIVGKYLGKQLGSFGDASIWSLSKFFATPVGGALVTKDTKLRRFVTNEYRHHDTDIERQAVKDLHNGNAARAYAVYNRLSKCPIASRGTMLQECKKGAIKKRAHNFNLLRIALWGSEEEKLLESSVVVPWMVPLFSGAESKKIAVALQKAGFESGVYHFDVNRNLLEPRFIECVALPCHQNLDDCDIDRIIHIVRGVKK